MKKKLTYREIRETDYIMRMMEDVFGHRVTSWNPADTKRLHGKLRQPTSDAEKEVFVAIVEPLMKRKTYISPDKDRYLDAFLDLDTRVSQQDFEPTEDPEAEKMDKLLGIDLT
jgi:hypothetical protein